MLSYVIRSWFLHAHNLLEQVRCVDLWLELMFDQAKLSPSQSLEGSMDT